MQECGVLEHMFTGGCIDVVWLFLAAFGGCMGRGWAEWVRVWRGVRVGCAAAAFGVLWVYRGHGDAQKRGVVTGDAAPHGWAKARVQVESVRVPSKG